MVVGLFTLLLALSFIPLGSSGGSELGFAPPVRALAKAPISVLAQVAGTSSESMVAKLRATGLPVSNDQQSVADLVGGDLRQQIGTITKVMPSRQP